MAIHTVALANAPTAYMMPFGAVPIGSEAGVRGIRMRPDICRREDRPRSGTVWQVHPSRRRDPRQAKDRWPSPPTVRRRSPRRRAEGWLDRARPRRGAQQHGQRVGRSRDPGSSTRHPTSAAPSASRHQDDGRPVGDRRQRSAARPVRQPGANGWRTHRTEASLRQLCLALSHCAARIVRQSSRSTCVTTGSPSLGGRTARRGRQAAALSSSDR